MARVHVSSTIDVPTYQRLEAFARDRGIVHARTGKVNLADAVRCALDLALKNGEEDDAGEGDHDQEP